MQPGNVHEGNTHNHGGQWTCHKTSSFCAMDVISAGKVSDIEYLYINILHFVACLTENVHKGSK